MKAYQWIILGALVAFGGLMLGAGPALGQAEAPAQTSQAPALQEHVAALKENLAKSQELLKQYEWVETRVMLLNGEEKNKVESRCHYGPDGKVVKEVISATPEVKGRGLKGKIIEKKKAEIAGNLKNAGDLIKLYIPPDPARIEAARKAGKITVAQEGPRVKIDIRDYEKKGDLLSFDLDIAQHTVLGLKVSTWMKEAKDAATMTTRLATLEDGAMYPAEIVLSLPSQSIEVRTTNSGYKKV